MCEMGKNNKSVQAKRRQRHKQKLKKRLKKNPLPLFAEVDSPSNLKGLCHKTTPHCSSLGSPSVHSKKKEESVGVRSESYFEKGVSPSSIFDSSFGSPGSPPSTPSTTYSTITAEKERTEENTAGGDLLSESYLLESLDQRDKETLSEIQSYTLDHQCSVLKELFLERTQCMHHYQDKVDSLQLEMNDLSRECKRKIQTVRRFWKDEILGEKSRAGKIFKNSLCSNSN